MVWPVWRGKWHGPCLRDIAKKSVGLSPLLSPSHSHPSMSLILTDTKGKSDSGARAVSWLALPPAEQRRVSE
ncbi:hypothetical protein XELAEV_18004730mg [Xenopus laevis]|uniref:Uncharacterized protein n=1 Tax=Xenopus laevis TaxID=8355 RepID=A0A974BPZ5_XENLA|nr:hypothetical protein XELAEV_18004730mg [Xenopus laevis]